jgi:hypothetical protein
MPETIGAIVSGAAAWVAGAAGGATEAALGAFGVSASTAATVGAWVTTAVYYGTELAIYAGLSYGLTPKVPKGEGSNSTFKQSRGPRTRGYGRYRKGGTLAFWDAKETKAGLVTLLHDGRINRFTGVFWLHDDQVSVVGNVVQQLADGRYWTADQRVKLDWRVGLPTETAYAMLVAAFPGKYTTAFRGDGIATLAQLANHGKLANFAHDFPYGEPRPSAEIEAQLVFDPRDMAQDEADPSTWAWSQNPALCLLHFLAYDRGYAYDISSAEVRTFNQAKWDRRFGNTLTYWTDAADICDEAVDLAAGDTTPRYQIGGEYDLTSDEPAVVQQFLTSMDGWLGSDGLGGAIVYAGKFSEPTVTLTDGEVKAYSISWGKERENRVNEIVVAFTNPANKYNESEADPWTDEAALEDDGQPLREDLQLPWVQSNSQARRLAKRRMERHQAAFTVQITCSFDPDPTSDKHVLGQRFLALDLETAPPSLRGAIVEVTGDIQIDLTRLTVSFPAISVDPEARDGWVPADEEGDDPGTGGDPDVEALAAPVISPPINILYEATGLGPDQPRLVIDAIGPDRADLTWFIAWRRQGLLVWNDSTTGIVDDAPGTTITLQSDFVPSESVLEVRIRYQTGGSQFSPWSAVETVTVANNTSLALDDEADDELLDESGLILIDEGT